MKKINSPYKKLMLLLVMLLVLIVFTAFGRPGYSIPSASQTENAAIAAKKGKVTGKVTTTEGNALQGVTVIVMGITNGMATDAYGNFTLKSVPQDGEIMFSYVGLKSVKLKPDLDQPMNVKLEIAAIGLQKVVVSPEEESTTLSVLSDEFGITIKGIVDNKPPLYVLDGRVIEKSEFNKMGADNIETISVLKDSSEIKKYGDRGKNGILIIASKKIVVAPAVKKIDDIKVPGDEVRKEKKFTIAEQMPQFPGGEKRLNYYLSMYTKYPKQAKADKLEGTVVVGFMVGKRGKVDKVKVLKGAYPAMDDEAYKSVLTMPYWTPGIQNGIPVEVYYTVPIEFSMQPAGNKSTDAKASTGEYLQEQIEQLQEQMVDMQEQMADYQNQMTELQKPMGVPQNQEGDRQKQMTGLNKQMADLLKQLPDCQKQTANLQKQLEVPQDQSADPKKQIVDLRIKIADLQKQMTELGEKLSSVQVQFGPIPYRQAEVMPKFPGGEIEMMKFLRLHLKYPVIAQKEGAAGTALVRFIVSSSGKIADAAVLNDIHPSLSAEALRVIRIMPGWIPGKKAGKAVNVACTIPFSFILQSNTPKSSENRDFLKGDFPEVVVVAYGTAKPGVA